MSSNLSQQLPTPAVVNTAVVNSNPGKVQVIIAIVGTATTVSKNGVAVTGSITSSIVTLNLAPGDTVTVSQTTAVTWTWWLL